jgi:hypothetical protein
LYAFCAINDICARGLGRSSLCYLPLLWPRWAGGRFARGTCGRRTAALNACLQLRTCITVNSYGHHYLCRCRLSCFWLAVLRGPVTVGGRHHGLPEAMHEPATCRSR